MGKIKGSIQLNGLENPSTPNSEREIESIIKSGIKSQRRTYYVEESFAI